MGKSQDQDPDPKSGSGMNNPDRISKSLETICWVKLHECLDVDPGWKNSDPGWKKSDPG